MAFFHDGALRPAQAASAVRRVHYELRALPPAESASPSRASSTARLPKVHALRNAPLSDETAPVEGTGAQAHRL